MLIQWHSSSPGFAAADWIPQSHDGDGFLEALTQTLGRPRVLGRQVRRQSLERANGLVGVIHGPRPYSPRRV